MFLAFPLPDGSYFELRNLPWAVVEDLEQKYDTSWAVIIDMPQVNGRILLELATAVAALSGYDPPAVSTVADLAAISESLVLVDESGVPIVKEAEEDAPLAWSAG